MKRVLNDFQYVCGTVFHDLPIDERSKDSYVLQMCSVVKICPVMHLSRFPIFQAKYFQMFASTVDEGAISCPAVWSTTHNIRHRLVNQKQEQKWSNGNRS